MCISLTCLLAHDYLPTNMYCSIFVPPPPPLFAQMLAINVATSVAEMPTDVDVSTCLTALANAATRCPQVSV